MITPGLRLTCIVPFCHGEPLQSRWRRLESWQAGRVGRHDQKVSLARVVDLARFDKAAQRGMDEGGQVVCVHLGSRHVSGQAGQDGRHVGHTVGRLQAGQHPA